jgi:hypothetical protein
MVEYGFIAYMPVKPAISEAVIKPDFRMAIKNNAEAINDARL